MLICYLHKLSECPRISNSFATECTHHTIPPIWVWCQILCQTLDPSFWFGKRRTVCTYSHGNVSYSKLWLSLACLLPPPPQWFSGRSRSKPPSWHMAPGLAQTASSLYFQIFFLAVLGLRCCTRAFSNCGERGLLFVAVCGLLIALASLVVEHKL